MRYAGPVPLAHGIALGPDAFYLLCDSSVECFGLDGAYRYSFAVSARPQAVLAGRQTYVFAGGAVQRVTAPAEDAAE